MCLSDTAIRYARMHTLSRVGHKKHTISLEPMVRALGVAKAEAPPVFYAFTGADQTGRFAG